MAIGSISTATVGNGTVDAVQDYAVEPQVATVGSDAAEPQKANTPRYEIWKLCDDILVKCLECKL